VRRHARRRADFTTAIGAMAWGMVAHVR
jgi:hypothetical protein